jgi:hypothetical protein
MKEGGVGWKPDSIVQKLWFTSLSFLGRPHVLVPLSALCKMCNINN